MVRKLGISGLVAAAALLALPVGASAGTVDFRVYNSSLGDLPDVYLLDSAGNVQMSGGNPVKATQNGIQSNTGGLQFHDDDTVAQAPVNARAYYYYTGSPNTVNGATVNTWIPTSLFTRNNPSADAGLGVCSPQESLPQRS